MIDFRTKRFRTEVTELNGKFLLIVVFAPILLVTLFPQSTSQQASKQDPWLNYDENGIIDARDLYTLGQSYGPSGDNVSVTNSPDWNPFVAGRRKYYDLPLTVGNLSSEVGPPSGKRWTILYSVIYVNTSPDVGDRWLYVYFTDGTLPYYQSQRNAAPILQGLTDAAFIFAVGETANTNAYPERANICLPYPNLLEAGDRFRATLVGGTPNDTFYGRLCVIESSI